MAGWTITPSSIVNPNTSSDGYFHLSNFYGCGDVNTQEITVSFVGNIGTNPYYSAQTKYVISSDCNDWCEPIIAWFKNGSSSTIDVNGANVDYVKVKRIDCQISVLIDDEFEDNPYKLNPNFDYSTNYTGGTNDACVGCTTKFDIDSSAPNCNNIYCNDNYHVRVTNASHVVRYWLNKKGITNANNQIKFQYTVWTSDDRSSSSTVTATTGEGVLAINASDDAQKRMIKSNNLLRLYIPSCSNGCQVEGIGRSSFSGNTSLTTVTMCNMHYIGNDAFRSCSSLENVEGIENVWYFGENSFMGCSSLGGTNVLDLSGAKVICNNAFYNSCTGISALTIGGSIISIGSGAFNLQGGTSGIKKIVVLASTPPFLGSNAFPVFFNTCYIYVPDEHVNDYKNASDWSTYESIIKPISEIPQN